MQHYMLNGIVNERLVAAANVTKGDVVLEIGPGTGSLTNVLVESGATVLGIEKVCLINLLMFTLSSVLMVFLRSIFFFLLNRKVVIHKWTHIAIWKYTFLLVGLFCNSNAKDPGNCPNLVLMCQAMVVQTHYYLGSQTN